MTKGRLITFEGPDGAGKTTVLHRVVASLTDLDCDVVTTREPGGVAIAEEIRSVILNPCHTAMDDKTELLLYIAARRQHLKEKIVPALEKSQLVLVDRFVDSSVAYQGFGRGLDAAAIEWLNEFATDGIQPDLTLYFDITAEEGLARIAQNRHTDDINRLDMEAVDMHRRVREGYLSLLEKHPERMVKIDASQPLDQVVSDALTVIKKRLFS